MPAIGIHKRFWSCIRKEKNCWVWTGRLHKTGYGELSIHPPGSGRNGGSRTVLAHRYAWQLIHGSIPEGKCVLHACDNRPCVNPAHLWLGDRLANARDRDAKGRGLPSIHKGEVHGMAKLTNVQVLEIRAAPKGSALLAKHFGVSYSMIKRIRNRQLWRHI